VVGFNAVFMSEHFGAFLTCIVLHAALAIRYVRSMLPPRQFQAAVRLVLTAGLCVGALLMTLVLGYVARSPTFGWTGEARARCAERRPGRARAVLAAVGARNAWLGITRGGAARQSAAVRRSAGLTRSAASAPRLPSPSLLPFNPTPPPGPHPPKPLPCAAGPRLRPPPQRSPIPPGPLPPQAAP
jgi:hypothetical protein